MYRIDVRDGEVMQNALRLLREALGFGAWSEMDASNLILNAKTRINRLTKELEAARDKAAKE